MKSLIRIAALILCASTASTAIASQDDATTTNALVLAGGGARGIAHAGVIAALEEMQIPVNAIAGTSMGALVGGLYAIGMTPEELKLVVDNMAWGEAFQDSVDRNNLPQRRKSDDYDYPTSLSVAFKDGQFSIPLGIVQGQQVRQIIKDLVIRAEHIRDFDELAIPYRAVATDIESGDAYIFSKGNMVTAMRASMSLPALLAPVEHDGRLLVDGGLAMNIPVEVGRQIGGERLIVVDIGTPLRTREEITSILGVTDQMLNFLTRKNSLEQLSTLGDNDILIKPDLTGIGMLDFEETEVIFQRGYDAAMAMRNQLLPLAVSDAAWADYLAHRTIPSATEPMVARIDIENNSNVSDDLIRARLHQQTDAALDRDQLGEDIEEIYALGHWEIIDYEVMREPEGDVLAIDARAKSWGDDQLKLGMNLASDLEGGSEINLGTSYRWTGLTDLGGELYARGQVGDTILFGAQFYQPLDVMSRFFVVPEINYRDHDATTLGPEYDPNEVVGTWRVRRLSAQLDTGVNLFDSIQGRLGVFRNRGDNASDKEVSGQLPEGSFDEGGVIASIRYDNMDNVFFPTQGQFLYADYQAYSKDLGSDANYERWEALGQAAFTHRRHTMILTGKTGQSLDAPNQPNNYFQLGGLFNLSGLTQNYFSGRQMAFAMAQYQYRLSERSVLPFDMPAYVGASIEGGQLWSERSEVSSGDFQNAGSVYVALDSPIGPIYLAYGRTEDSLDALYVSLGWPFLTNMHRLGR
ncbi:hypothetical protein BST95_00885 [Halioglobus japonicus]|uniref:PNPLA domain-containing protein n=1 Tax=Halioglobus japonicus TaxID=930805 RepID=A0AAP8MC23_9GAMM|nr:patatin-like phospholipase family protein [Halioglobus japonicus]AQA16988.1 hypothetical protein BST95_00885 [Halioglobus japonicus]PLW84874.1 hypothetical protein C0029_17940 [Halioglobus japonicus]GHD21906.1 patatin [Halioglobus japonicus]